MVKDVFDAAKKCNFTSNEILSKLEELKSTHDSNIAKKLKDDVVMAHVRMIGLVMRPYNKFKTIQQDDLFTEGVVGIYEAIDKFDLAKDVKFSTYAYWWIKQKIQRYVEENCLNKLDKGSMSIDSKVGGDEDGKRTIGDMLPDESQSRIEDVGCSDVMNKVLEEMDDREKLIIQFRYGINMRVQVPSKHVRSNA